MDTSKVHPVRHFRQLTGLLGELPCASSETWNTCIEQSSRRQSRKVSTGHAGESIDSSSVQHQTRIAGCLFAANACRLSCIQRYLPPRLRNSYGAQRRDSSCANVAWWQIQPGQSSSVAPSQTRSTNGTNLLCLGQKDYQTFLLGCSNRARRDTFVSFVGSEVYRPEANVVFK